MNWSLKISYFVIALVFGVQILNEIVYNHYIATGYLLFGFIPPTSTETYNNLNDKLVEYNESNLNVTVQQFINPTEQPEGSGIMYWIDNLVKSLKFARIVFDVLFYSTLGFGDFINEIFRFALGGINLLSGTLKTILTSFVCIIHLISVYELVRGIQIGD